MVLGATVLGCSGGTTGAAGDGGAKADAGFDAGKVPPVPEASADVPTIDAHEAATGDASEAGEAGKEKCHYPAGPYGTAVGDVLDPSKIDWQVYAPGSTTSTTLTAADLYDCDGTLGINAIVVDTSAQWCIACQYEAGNIPTWMGSTGAGAANWTSLGVMFLTLIIQNNAYEPATILTAEQWRTTWSLTSSIYVASDPSDTFPAMALPHNLLIDPRTMKITRDLDNDSGGGEEDADPAVTALAKTNAM